MPNRRFSRGDSKRFGMPAEVLESGFPRVRAQGRPPLGVTDTGMALRWPAIVAESASPQERLTVLSTIARHKRMNSHNLLIRK